MKNRQLSLSDIQKDYISKEEFYQIAHICKETALWLIETGRVSAEKPKRKGFGYKIAKEEVERYLADRQQNPLYYLKGKRHNCIPYTPPQPYSSELGGAIRLAVEQEMSSLPDLLTEKQVCAILGYRPKQILDWKHSGKLIALKCFNKTYFPTCASSYYQEEKNVNGGKDMVRMQYCSDPRYNSPVYTNQMLLEDWGNGCCRFWTPIPEKGNDYEKQLLHCSAQCHRGRPSLVHRQHHSEKPPSDEGGAVGV